MDTEMMMGILSRAGYSFTNDSDEADVMIVNTCGFINDAKKESIDTIFETAQLKKSAGLKGIIV
ncbi:MAG: 30S ribosomal protein S12 methylthiotransferase RimO, partial [Eubacteriales bacterium]